MSRKDRLANLANSNTSVNHGFTSVLRKLDIALTYYRCYYLAVRSAASSLKPHSCSLARWDTFLITFCARYKADERNRKDSSLTILVRTNRALHVVFRRGRAFARSLASAAARERENKRTAAKKRGDEKVGESRLLPSGIRVPSARHWVTTSRAAAPARLIACGGNGDSSSSSSSSVVVVAVMVVAVVQRVGNYGECSFRRGRAAVVVAEPRGRACAQRAAGSHTCLREGETEESLHLLALRAGRVSDKNVRDATYIHTHTKPVHTDVYAYIHRHTHTQRCIPSFLVIRTVPPCLSAVPRETSACDVRPSCREPRYCWGS